MRTALLRTVAAGAVGLVGLAGVAIGATAVLPATAAPSDETIEDPFLAHHAERIRDSLESLVTDGTIDAAQADAVAEALADEMGPRGGAGHGMRGANLDAAAEALGLTTDELRDALADGSTLADVADAQGVAVDDLVAALVAAAEARIDDAVADGRIDAEEASELKAGLTERITERVESGTPVGGGHHGERGGGQNGGMGGGHHGGGMGGMGRGFGVGA
ncbi:hypothetical protein [Actinotalea sp. Marseille-Q4924]|uniref:hypothetical protein n=1 Tax=Actinotalea sp. Marseille-Q4924 TaxID=2866571 RepID=UPI001CE3DFB8|nr:hypothetical protein [Actinotalea sp. Marseille-Q4924]